MVEFDSEPGGVVVQNLGLKVRFFSRPGLDQETVREASIRLKTLIEAETNMIMTGDRLSVSISKDPPTGEFMPGHVSWLVTLGSIRHEVKVKSLRFTQEHAESELGDLVSTGTPDVTVTCL